ncbi:MAG: hypothetical protein K5912_00825 [Alphaproteobacteria bacterium]|nr:hypothetical protein [Alphaproteobacteria bacterium]
MSQNKRLFLFAGFDKNGIIDDALVYYVSNLSKIGDVVLCMDSNIPRTELQKLDKFVLHASAKRHGEYDFGSYKRAYAWAKKNLDLDTYDFIYIVNDSVYGPLVDISQTINQIEKLDTDAAGLVVSKHKTHSFMESWFVRLNKKIFTSKWFCEFISGIKKQPTKNSVTVKYEHGLSNLIKDNNCSWDGVYICHGRSTYNNPKVLFKRGCPFIKKACFIRHNGALGKEIKYVLDCADKSARQAVISSANKTYGPKHMKWLLTKNPFKIIVRKITYAVQKIKKR